MSLRRGSISAISSVERAASAKPAVACTLQQSCSTPVLGRGDLTSKRNLNIIKRDMRMRRLLAAMIATPCTSWSQARNRTNVIRTAAEPWGNSSPPKPLSRADIERLRVGNQTMRASIEIIRVAHSLGLPWALENPTGSVMWSTSFLRGMARDPRVSVAVFDQCAFGQPWRKRTRVMFGNCDEADVEALRLRRCHGKRICSFTRRPHVQLTGSGPDGKPLTARAQEFPKSLSSQLARILLHDVLNARTQRH